MLPLLAILVAEPNPANIDESRRTMAAYTSCLINRLGYKLRPVMDMPVGSPQANAKMIALNDSGCLPSDDVGGISLKFKPTLMRGGLFEAFYLKEFVHSAPATFDGVPTISYPVGDVSGNAEAARYSLQMDIGDCVVRKAPAEARTLLGAEVASVAEGTAITALVPALSACATKGRTLSLSKSIVRGMIAEPLYRLTAAKRKMTNA
ncbi:hypothetical protein M9979_00510 [Sphingomonas sp. RP10(2022)]|uniref:Uncharacterized protein n=1 Tax=Sphingomonas liriopis TaxID=2949094 RepID=A0A9X2HND7_9SPHN|nr:hypothetical protein [Sphingomonas liriopis]MCP3733367.1 hypothetical protein [Sphingomonas liriopis]